MLVLSRRVEEGIVIQDHIVVTVLAVEGDRVKLGIAAPRHVTVLRQELCEAVRRQNLAAARLNGQADPAQAPELRRALEILRRRAAEARPADPPEASGVSAHESIGTPVPES